MFLIHLLFLMLLLTALLVQLVTPLVLNIPMMALILLIFIITIGLFKRARKKKRFPIVASLSLLLQSILFCTSIAIFVGITIPYERPEDSPAVVKGIRRFLVAQGFLENTAIPSASGVEDANRGENPPATINAPEASKIEIKIEDEPAIPKEKAAAGAASNPEPPKLEKSSGEKE
ncbi:MAG TPA: hypothetical protein PLY93_11460 [Turneriella sp.]|nr:hypothetical protein [Turneriella sp.]